MPHDTSHARAPEPDSDSWEEVDLGLDEGPSADEVAKKAAEQIEASMPPELRDQAEEAVQEITGLSPKEKKSLFGGLANIGYWANQKKALLLSGVADRLEKKFTHSAVRRLLTAASESYRKDAVRAQKAMDNPKVLSTKQLGNVGAVLSWGRVAFDIAGRNASRLNPFRHVTAGAMAIGRGGEILKEMRLMNEEVKDQTQFNIDAALDEAWALHEKVYGTDGESLSGMSEKEVRASGERLNQEYLSRLPKELLARLRENPGSGASILAKLAERDLAFGLARAEKALQKLEENKKMSPAEKKRKRDQYLASQEQFLKDADRMITQMAGVDVMAWAARSVEAGAKTASKVMLVDTIARLPSMLVTLHQSFEHFSISSFLPRAEKSPMAYEVHPDLTKETLATSDAAYLEHKYKSLEDALLQPKAEDVKMPRDLEGEARQAIMEAEQARLEVEKMDAAEARQLRLNAATVRDAHEDEVGGTLFGISLRAMEVDPNRGTPLETVKDLKKLLKAAMKKAETDLGITEGDHLTKEAIGNVAAEMRHYPSGRDRLVLVDVNTGENLSLKELIKRGWVKETGVGKGRGPAREFVPEAGLEELPLADLVKKVETGMGEVKFSHGGDGSLEGLKVSANQAAGIYDGLYRDDWRSRFMRHLSETRDARAESGELAPTAGEMRHSIREVGAMQAALRELQSDGNGETSEAKLLQAQLTEKVEDVRARFGDVLKIDEGLLAKAGSAMEPATAEDLQPKGVSAKIRGILGRGTEEEENLDKAFKRIARRGK